MFLNFFVIVFVLVVFFELVYREFNYVKSQSVQLA